MKHKQTQQKRRRRQKQLRKVNGANNRKKIYIRRLAKGEWE